MALFGKPRILQLAEVASRAELLRRRRQVRSYVLRAAFGGGGAVFAVLTLIALHLALWAALARPLGSVGGAFAVVALDLALCLILGWLAARRRTDQTADDAVAVRDTALRGAQAEMQTLGGLLRPSADVPEPQKRRVRVYPN